MELEALQAIVADIEKLGASMVVISPQLDKFSKQVAKKNNITYPVLCDTSNKVASQFGLVFELPNDLRELYKKFGIDLERFNGDTSWQLPMPGRFILNQQGVLLNSEVNPDYTQRPDPFEIIDILKNQ